MPFTVADKIEPKLKFSTDYSTGDFEFWRQDMSELYTVDPMESAQNTGQFEVRRFLNPRGVITASTYDRQFMQVTKKHSGRIGNFIFVLRYLSGGALGQTNGAPLFYRPGDVMINDYARQYDGVHYASKVQGIYLEKEHLGLDCSAPLSRLDFPASSTMAKLLQHEMDGLYDPLLSGDKTLHLSRFERFISCVKMGIQRTPPDGDVRTRAREALKDLICEYIEQNVGSPELSTSTLLREFGVSRATLYRMFESENGVRNHIATRRLYRAVLDLSAAPKVRGKVHEVSERWGFSSDANFSRSVRRQFGTSPGMLFGAAVPSNPASQAAEGLPSAGNM